ncbi:restriction endonuclease [Rhodovastum atsumiense]|uniref:Restriction endonuclease n=1 Tax=Rhodovastum atsumiense TaxID=504468 RepID=A0A5M6IN16_9PROT|nr:restriction endonuclease [Rhodovastum atsumiense]KAA5609651.1 restriction endonuclease [Rhodovastum atsumiense]
MDASFFENERPAARSTPAQFEAECAAILSALGWCARCVGRSGDQGADVIATKAGVRIVLQCKLYTAPVGNRAVQEAYAAVAYHGAHRAAVVASSGFTTSARALAAQTGVLLLHPDQLGSADRLFGVPEPVAPTPKPPRRVIRRCPSCGTGLRLPQWRAGHVRCPCCGHRFWCATLFF